MADDEIEARRRRMASDLEAAIKVHGGGGQRHYYATVGLGLAAAVSSFIAGILAFAEADKTLVGICALVPAAATVLIGALKLQEKANWYYRKKDELLALNNALQFELPNPPTAEAIRAISTKWSALNKAMQGDWSATLALSLEDLKRDVGKTRAGAGAPGSGGQDETHA